MVNQLLQPILTGGLRSVHFFNGRLLSGEDLLEEQEANREARKQLGRAIGEGVAVGLEVKLNQAESKKQTPVVTVSPGLAVNRNGQALELKEAVDIGLARPQPTPGELAKRAQPAGARVTATFTAAGTFAVNRGVQAGQNVFTIEGSQLNSGGLFAECLPPQTGPYIVGQGVYLLAIQPAFDLNGKAPVSGLGNLDAACNAKNRVDGVQFRLVQVPVTQAELSDAACLRNHLAYRCFGTDSQEFSTFHAKPFGLDVKTSSLLDNLRSTCFKDGEDVPLALIYWTAAEGVKFIDLWSVRRRITPPAADAAWPLLTSDRVLAEGEARFLQFEDQIRDMSFDSTENLGTLSAAARFEALPPVGILPIADINSPGGFNWQAFFGDLAPEGLDQIDAARLPFLIRESFSHQPFSVGDISSGKLTLYQIRENVDAVKAGASTQLVVVFARPGVTYCGAPRFGYAVWDTSRFD